ncbi:MAG: ester cyclase [Alphaproteobacteria bacterium]|jgi:predicted ester cyclase|nr:SnoaL-like domain-containing protein [Rhodospirillaceae bacterium]MDG2482472.1 ester cyclase [Alphaproteobacteria bacterium]MBT6202835.1 SnoaL-like domain-containing protein [Rhodospirillaceae bacterium]MBT6512326.1 SnoaL-like domain-containing protein [Rhodospirillaceae bacterium]MBT7612133.1 SnoaL-like domain-containing protein [Rhodospirillaceae bacterium]
MTPEQMSQAIDDTWAAYTAGDVDAFVAGCAADVVYCDNGRDTQIHGRDAFRNYVSGWIVASSDRRAMPFRKTIDGDRVATELRLELTHDRAPMYGVEPAGAKLAFEFVMIADFADGEIVKITAYYNAAVGFQALGLLGDLPTTPGG